MRRSNSLILSSFLAILAVATIAAAQGSSAPPAQGQAKSTIITDVPAPAQNAPAAPAQAAPSQSAPANPQGGAKATIITDPSAVPPADAQTAPQSAPAPGTQGAAAPPQQGAGAAPADDNASSQMPTVGNKDTMTVPAQNGQAPETETENGTFLIKKQVEEVVLHATVVDDKGRLVTDLAKDAFTVYEDGKPQQITSFRREDIPVALGILIDNSGSMRDKRQKVNEAAINLVKASNPDDKVFVVNFNEEFFLDQDFTADVPKLREALDKIDSRGGTAMYDAVDASAKYLQENAKRLDDQFHIQKKALLVVTDGEDNSSRDSLEQIVRKLQAEDAPTVYTIGILGDEHSRKARRALQALSEQTGGLAFFPKDVNEVDQISQTIARDIRSQYTIGFKKNPSDTTGYRSIKVVAKAPGHKQLQVRTLSGYYAGQERAAK